MPGVYYTTSVEEYLEWPKANYEDPVQRTWLPAFAIVWQILSTVFVFGRLFLRLRNRCASFGLDDAFITLAWIFSVAFTTAACVLAWDHELGRHVWDMHLENWTPALKIGWLAQVFFLQSTCATKVSILLFYRRLLRGTYSNAWRYLMWILLLVTFSSWLGFFFTYCFVCIPLSDVWNWPLLQLQGYEAFNCISGDHSAIAVGVMTIASDLYCAALPCAFFQYHDIGVTRQQKIALNVIFCLSFLVTGVGISRTYFLWKLGNDVDTTWVGFNLYTCSVVECQLAIICICAPSLRAFFRVLVPAMRLYGTGHNHSQRTVRDSKIVEPNTPDDIRLTEPTVTHWSPT